jgi:hypothetical protein
MFAVLCFLSQEFLKDLGYGGRGIHFIFPFISTVKYFCVLLYCWQSHLPTELVCRTTTVVVRATYRLALVLPQSHPALHFYCTERFVLTMKQMLFSFEYLNVKYLIYAV